MTGEMINWKMRERREGLFIPREEGARQDDPDPVMKCELS